MNNPHPRTDELLLAIAQRFRANPVMKGRFVFDDPAAATDTELATLMPVVADMIEGVLALPFKYQMLIRLMGGPDAMPADAAMRAWLTLYHQDVLGRAPAAIEAWINSLETT